MKLETFFEKFDQFADAPDAVAKMRELVFQLAVQGRLVQQDRTEESATVLLKQIRAARAALPANRRSSDKTDTTELEEESPAFAAPSGWTWTSLGNVQIFTNGYAFKSEDYQSSGVGIIRMGELGANGEIDERNMKYVTNDIAQSLPDTFRVRPGDLLMGMSGSIGKLAINRSDKTYLLNQRVGRLEPILIEKAFLHVFLKTVEQHYLRISFGMAIKNLSTKQINETPFPLPPLAEQKRIVAKVDELMALCDRLEAQQKERETRHAALARASLARFADAPTPANLNFIFHKSYAIPPADLRKSILTLAVQGKLVTQDPNDEPAKELRDAPRKAEGKKAKWAGQVEEQEQPFQLPPSWKWFRLGDVSSLKHGYAFSSNFFTSEPAPFVLTTPGNFYEKGGFRDRESKRKYYSGPVDPEFVFKPGDLIIPMTEQAAGLLGSPAFIPDDGRVYIHNQRLGKLSFSEEAAPQFAFWFFNCDFFRGELARTCTGMKVRHTSPDRVLKVPFPLPPLAEQRRIVAKVEQLMGLVDALETQLAASRATAANLLSAVVAELTTCGNADASTPS